MPIEIKTDLHRPTQDEFTALAYDVMLFEWKSVERLSPEHRGQLLNYLLLCDLPNGKLVNVRPESIEHEFVNTTLRPNDRRCLQTDSSKFTPLDANDNFWMEFLCEAIDDWGAGLDVHLYESAIAHILGGDEIVLREIDILVNGQIVGSQKARRTPSGAAFKVTTLQQSLNAFERHAQKFLMRTTLPAIHWVNVSRQSLQITTLKR